MGKRIVSAPGKIILAGEHAVVYGYPAIVAAIDRRLEIEAERKQTNKEYSGLIKYALGLMLKKGETVEITIKSNLKIGSGLGSSAALATALVWVLKTSLPEWQKNELVKKIEDYQHGRSSGVDQAIVREGGFLWFKKPEFKKIRLPIKEVILIDSGKPKESTKEMVKLVAKGDYKKEFVKIGKIVENWKENLISENEVLLEKIGVVGEKAKKMIREIEEIGGMAKICGAGGIKAGSGMLLARHHDQEKLMKLIKVEKWPYIRVNLGAAGVRYER